MHSTLEAKSFRCYVNRLINGMCFYLRYGVTSMGFSVSFGSGGGGGSRVSTSVSSVVKGVPCLGVGTAVVSVGCGGGGGAAVEDGSGLCTSSSSFFSPSPV